MEWPKRVRTVDYKRGVLTLDGDKHIEFPKLTLELIEKFAAHNLVGFHVEGYPLTDELLAPFTGHKSMVNFGVKDALLTDNCFSVFSSMPKLCYLQLDGNIAMNGRGLFLLQSSELELLSLNRTGLDDNGLLMAAKLPKLTHIHINDTAVTMDGLLAIAGNNRIEPVASGQFSEEQLEYFSKLQREKSKNNLNVDSLKVDLCQEVLFSFFEEMTDWESYVHRVGFEDGEVRQRLKLIWEKYVSEKPCQGYRPTALSYSPSGTYSRVKFIDAEQLTRNKLYIYAKEEETDFEFRFLMKHTEEGWKIDGVQMKLKGWQKIGL